jgi:hypothetical protein
MKLISSIAAISIVSASMITTNPVRARPFLYLDTFTHGQTHQKCIDRATKVLNSNGFEEVDEEIMLKHRLSEITGYHKNESVTAVIECNQKLGITAFAVSGLDNEITYRMYQVLYDAEW